jgi:hypothetical protein
LVELVPNFCHRVHLSDALSAVNMP